MSTANSFESLSHLETKPIRVVTAASLFDGHDAAINIMRRLLQSQGAEVIHLGHDRSVQEIVDAAIGEDAHAIAVSSYQGGHVEFFTYLVDLLRERGAGDILVFGGGGGTITEEEIQLLEARGVTQIFSPEDGRKLGLEGMIRSMLERCRNAAAERVGSRELKSLETSQWELGPENPGLVARLITELEEVESPEDAAAEVLRMRLAERIKPGRTPVIGFTGTGGAGKSSVVDELVRRHRMNYPEERIALLLIDPTRRRSGGALLGDRIRMNAIHADGVFVRSMATRRAHLALSHAVRDAIQVLKAACFDVVFVETAGIGQSDSEIVDLADASLYIMTPEFGAPSQLEKIDMLDLADLIVLNKSDRHGAQDALRDIRKQWRRNHARFEVSDENVPVFPTVARRWRDPGTDRLYRALRIKIEGLRGGNGEAEPETQAEAMNEQPAEIMIPASRSRYLAEIAQCLRSYHQASDQGARHASLADGLARALGALGADVPAMGKKAGPLVDTERDPGNVSRLDVIKALRTRYDEALAEMSPGHRAALAEWPDRAEAYRSHRQSYRVRGRDISVENHFETLSGTQVPKVALPQTADWGEILRFVARENLPGSFPFTAGVFPFQRTNEDPTRMFAGEGGPARTNRRFHYLAEGQPAARLSTAFDSVTLYGRDPHRRPDIYGKVGNSGVSICTLDDAKVLYSGFDLVDPTTSVSLTINGPAPMLLAFFLNAAIDQQVERHLVQSGELEAVREKASQEAAARGEMLPQYPGERPPNHDGLGLGLLGIPGDRAVVPEVYERIRSDVLGRVRGTVQADILKEDQAQNTCIFSTDFALKMQGDMQEYFIEHAVRNFYSVSISGYHMAEAGANPITQLAFTLANGLTFCEYYLARGMSIDDFAPNFSFFFSNGLDAEYDVIGRVARRIWAVAMREYYQASERSQKLKYHIQTSGRSLHAQEMAFNDIRTTLQALTAIQDSCNSLHTNAYDEAVTTPTEESVRRAMAIQLIINRELGTARNENSIQGGFYIDALTDLVEEAVLQEFERLSDRGGVLGAMETLYQRGKIQDESLEYETRKHTGDLPVVGVNTFVSDHESEESGGVTDLMRSTDDEKEERVESLRRFQSRWQNESETALDRLVRSAATGENVFDELMETVKTASLGQMSEALFSVGGRYRRSM